MLFANIGKPIGKDIPHFTCVHSHVKREGGGEYALACDCSEDVDGVCAPEFCKRYRNWRDCMTKGGGCEDNGD
ncbi:MAG: hypothetical protein RSG23_05025 [Gordonibacter sp.]|uniref:hypothetical protein n=1 Tax=Gordonibacter sp. TaxID=1968902 RepID=UPI002FC6F984